MSVQQRSVIQGLFEARNCSAYYTFGLLIGACESLSRIRKSMSRCWNTHVIVNCSKFLGHSRSTIMRSQGNNWNQPGTLYPELINSCFDLQFEIFEESLSQERQSSKHLGNSQKSYHRKVLISLSFQCHTQKLFVGQRNCTEGCYTFPMISRFVSHKLQENSFLSLLAGLFGIWFQYVTMLVLWERELLFTYRAHRDVLYFSFHSQIAAFC